MYNTGLIHFFNINIFDLYLKYIERRREKQKNRDREVELTKCKYVNVIDTSKLKISILRILSF